MRSVTSFFNLTLCKKDITRFWPLWAGYLLIWLLAIPLQLLTLLEYRRLGWGDGYNALEAFARDIAYNMVDAALVMALTFGVMAAMAMFSHLYSARSANFMGGLPIKRDAAFLTQYLTGLGFLVVPNLAVFLLALAIEGAVGCLYIQPLLAWLAMSCGMGFFFYSFAVLMGQIAGHLLALPVFYGIFNGLAAGLYFLINWIMEAFYYGFDTMGDGAERLTLWLTPVYQLSEVRPRWTELTEGAGEVFILRNGGYLAVYAAVAVVFAVLSWLGYRTRRLESAGDVVAVKWIRPVFKYSVSFCAGLAFGMVTSEILNLGTAGLVVCVVLWAAVGCFVAQMILDKSFKVFAGWRGPAAMAAVMLLLCAVVLFDLTGYETRVPDAADVASVDIGRINSYPDDQGGWRELAITDPEVIAAAVDVHRAVITQRETNDDYREPGSEITGYRITYTLNSGATFTRTYSGLAVRKSELNTPGTVTCELTELVRTEGYRRACYGLDDQEQRELLDVGYVDYLSFHGIVDGEEIKGESIDRLASMELLRAVLGDIEAGRAGTRSLFYEEPAEYAYLSFDLRRPSTLWDSSQVTVYEGYGYDSFGDVKLEPATESVAAASLYLTITPEAAESWPLLLAIYDEYLAQQGEE